MKKIPILTTIALSIASISAMFANQNTIADLKPQMLLASNFKEKPDFRLQKLEAAIEQHEEEKPQDWDTLVDIVKQARIDHGDYAMIATANVIINQIPYVDGTDGSYFPPLKGFQRGGVVCKDYAVAKYILLKEAGFPAEKMALLIHQSVLDPENGAHVVLIVDIDNELWIANQFWNSTANEFYKDNKIDRKKFQKEIREKGVAALRTDIWFDNKYNKKSLTKLRHYAYTDRLVLSVVNEYGIFQQAKFDAMQAKLEKLKANQKPKPQPKKKKQEAAGVSQA